MAKYKVPSQAANGSQTFSDNLVGVQITDGSSQLTNTNFALDKTIPERDAKNFKTNPFSDFLTLDDLKIEESAPITQSKLEKNQSVKFRDSKKDSGKSLYGSLKSRIGVAVTKIIKFFPAAVMVDIDSPKSQSGYTAYNITYNQNTKRTRLDIESGMFYNPFDVLFTKPNTNTVVTVDNPIRNFYSSYKKYVIELSGVTYNIVGYVEPNTKNKITLTVLGNPFNGQTTSNSNFLIRPNDGVKEEFFIGLDDLESSLLNRETLPIYQSTFKVPRDINNGSVTSLLDVKYNWPISKDNYNLQIVGIAYDEYINNLVDVADEIDDYKSNLLVRFLSSPQLFEFDSDDKKAESVFQLYGQSFDKVKKYIDNIAYMRNVSYDGVNNLPDILLKNLSNTLGLSTINLFDEKDLNELLYTRTDTQYSGLTVGTTIVDAENEFYRRLLVNLSYIYKSKGTRSSIEFFLKFLGAPEPLIKIDEYIYTIVSLPKSFNIDSEIRSVIMGDKIDLIISGFTPSTYSYSTGTTLASTTYTREEYPVTTDGLPRGYSSDTNNNFFLSTCISQRPSIRLLNGSYFTGTISPTYSRNTCYVFIVYAGESGSGQYGRIFAAGNSTQEDYASDSYFGILRYGAGANNLGIYRNNQIINPSYAFQSSGSIPNGNLITAAFNGTTLAECRVNGISVSQGNTNTYAATLALSAYAIGTNVRTGYGGEGFFEGYVSEVLMYSTLTSEQDLSVEAYLKQKWNV